MNESHPAPRPLVLIADDEDEPRSLLEFVFRRKGYEVALAETGRATVLKARELRPAVIVLDYHLGDMTAAQVLGKLEFTDGEPRPVIGILTGSASTSLPKRMLSSGVDFYHIKTGPPSSALVEQVEAIMRRSSSGAILRAGTVWLDVGRGLLAQAGGQAVRLTPVETRLLAALMRARPGAATWRALEAARCSAEGGSAAKASTSVRVEATRLRKKLRVAKIPLCIETCRGLGLKLAVLD